MWNGDRKMKKKCNKVNGTLAVVRKEKRLKEREYLIKI